MNFVTREKTLPAGRHVFRHLYGTFKIFSGLNKFYYDAVYGVYFFVNIFRNDRVQIELC